MATNRLNVSLRIVGQHLLNGQIHQTDTELVARKTDLTGGFSKVLTDMKLDWTMAAASPHFGKGLYVSTAGERQVVLADGPVRIIGFEPFVRYPF